MIPNNERELNYSKVKTYKDSPYLFKLKYVEGKREGLSPATSLGVSIHRTLEEYHANSNDPKTVLSSYVRKKLDYALDNPGLSRIFTTEVLGGGRNLGKYWPVAVKSTQQKVDLINRWISEGRMRAVNPTLLLMQIWGMTQHYADYGVQVHIMLGLAPDEPIDREPIVRELTSFVLLGCGLAPD